jgi:BolA family transcriptional regulator, general stress-responsive regulator
MRCGLSDAWAFSTRGHEFRDLSGKVKGASVSIEKEIRQRLEIAFQPSRLEVVNDSHRHAGHSGDDGSGESHFSVLIRSEALASQSRVARHRAVHKALGEITTRVHALAIDAG